MKEEKKPKPSKAEEKKPSKAEEKKTSNAEEKKPSKGQWHGGKGSNQRPMKGNQKKYADAWDKIWGKTHEKINEQIKKQIKDNPILLYMKGTPQAPECGFSQKVVEILAHFGKAYSFVNILEDPDIRKELPKVSDWPTFPQLYINGEFMGGSDIVEGLYRSGELQEKIK